MKLGVLMNAGAGRARRDAGLADRLRDAVGRDSVFATGRPDEVPAALEVLREQGADTLLIVGGDGTVAGSLTPLVRGWPEGSRPAVALTRGGTVNTIAKSVGSPGPPDRVARQLVRRPEARRSKRLAIVRASAEGADPRYGMIFVNGVGVRWLEMYYGDSRLGVRGAASVVARIATSAIARGELARRIFSPFQAELQVDGESVPAAGYTVMAASSIREIGLGFAPFQSAGSDPARIHFAVTSASALGILREMPALRTGRQAIASSLVHRSVREVRIRPQAPEPWSLDADLFPPARELCVGAGPALDFVSVPAGFR